MTWPTKKLNDVILDIKDGGTPSRKNPEYFDGSINWCVVNDIQDEIWRTKETLTELGLKKSSAKVWPEDSIIISLGATIGNIGIAKVPTATKQGLTGIIVDKQKIIPKFLFYTLLSRKKYIQSLARGVTIKEVRPTQFAKVFTLSLPPLKIQQNIVDRLDVIRKAQKLNIDLIQRSDELFHSLLHKELNSKNKDWKVEKLEENLVDTTNGFASRPVAKGVGQLRPNNIDSDGTLNFSSIKFVPESHRNIKDYFLKNGDILFNNTNSVELVGKTAFIDKDYNYAFSNHMTRIRVNRKKINTKFLAIFLQRLFSMGKFRFSCTPWVNQAAINSTTLKRLKILLPPLDTQEQIVEKLFTIQDYKKKLLEQKTKLQELFDSCLDKTMKGKL